MHGISQSVQLYSIYWVAIVIQNFIVSYWYICTCSYWLAIWHGNLTGINTDKSSIFRVITIVRCSTKSGIAILYPILSTPASKLINKNWQIFIWSKWTLLYSVINSSIAQLSACYHSICQVPLIITDSTPLSIYIYFYLSFYWTWAINKPYVTKLIQSICMLVYQEESHIQCSWVQCDLRNTKFW